MAAFVFALGLIFGSFANVVALRFGTGESLVTGGSRCFACSRRLRWLELIPVISYVFLRGRCRSCGSGISLQYPLVELVSGLIFFFLYLSQSQLQRSPLWVPKGETFGWITLGVFALSAAFFWVLLVLSIYDARHQMLPDALVGSAAAIAVISTLLLARGTPRLIATHALSGILLFAFFWAFWCVSRGQWMGLGDAKLAFAIGIFLGPTASLVAFILAFWTGAIIGVGWVLWARAKTLKIPIPFGPFLAAGAFAAYLWSDPLIEAYLRLVVY